MRVLIVEDSYLVQQINVENGCYAKRRERTVSRESQCDAKKFCMRSSPREGGVESSKSQNSKTRKSQIAKTKIANLPNFPKED